MAATAEKPADDTSSASNEDIRSQLQVVAPGDVVDWVNLLGYGEPGVGKTTFLGTALDHPKTRPALIFDIEGGMTTLRSRKDLDVVPLRSIEELTDKYNKLWRSIDAKTGKMYYQTVCIDSGTELADLDMRGVMEIAYNANPDKVNKDVPSPREWGIVRSHMRKITRAFKDLPCNFIMTATLGEKTPEGQPTYYFPGFGGKLQREVPGFMDIVGMMTTDVDPVSGVVSRQIQVQGTKRVVAKDRTSALGSVVQEPTIPLIWDMIMESNS